MDFLKEAIAAGATDLHIGVDQMTYIRCLGELQALEWCDEKQYITLEQFLMNLKETHSFILKEDKEMVKDFSCTHQGIGRMRVRRYQSDGKKCMAIRFLPEKIPTMEALDFPDIMENFCKYRDGLLLVTGATGSGKSTTLAAMLEYINMTRACHILTLESPIEYLFDSKLALVHQCSIPDDMASFSEGAENALRMDPDVIMVGEIQNAATMRAALTLAETGHLVLATLHTGRAVDTIGRLLSMFSGDEQVLVRTQLAQSLRAVIAQRLIKSEITGSLKAAYEILVNNSAVSRQIRDDECHLLQSSMENGKAQGMIILEDAVAQLVKNGQLTFSEAACAVDDKEHFLRNIQA